MSTIAAKRGVLATVRHAQSSTRSIYSSAINQVSARSSEGLANREPEEITLPPIFDIFDAPSRLSESSCCIREKYTVTSKAPEASTPSAASAATLRSPPTSLPAPIIFDGPAKPKNAALALRSRLRQAGASTSTPHHHRRPLCSRSFSSSEPLVQLFEGPAKIIRHYHQPPFGKQQQTPSPMHLAALGVAGFVGFATVAENDNSQS